MEMDMEDVRRPLPRPTLDSEPYWRAARNRELHLQRCRACGSYRFYPSSVCWDCLSPEFDWLRVSGRGTVYSHTTVHRPPSDAFAADVPYVIALIALEEGPCLMSNVVECPPEAVRIGMPVKVAFRPMSPEITLPVFTPAGG